MSDALMTWLQVFYEFFKTGLFSVGGGLATLPFLYAMSRTTGWFSSNDIADMIAVSESTPGPIGVNMATYAGFTTLGILGGVWATVSLTLPSVIVILIISRILEKFKESDVVQRVFWGLRPASTAMITAAGLGVAKISLLNWDLVKQAGLTAGIFRWECIVLAAAVYFFYKKFKLHPILCIVIGAAAGVALKL